MSGPVVVGVSPSTGSPNALRWGAEEARLRGTSLRAVLAWRPPRTPTAPAGRPPGVSAVDPAEAEREAREQLAQFIEASGVDGTVRIDCKAVRGTAVQALIDATEDAELLVVGEPRPGRMASVRASLVAPQLVMHARCPVVVLPGPPQ